MQNKTLSRVLLGILLCSSGFLFASEEDYVRERGEQGGHPGVGEEIRHLKQRHQNLLAKAKELKQSNAPESELAEVSKQIGMISRELHMHQTRHEDLPLEFRAHAEKLEVASRRIHHFRVAAENLKMAEAHDLAHDIMEKVASMERDVQEGKKRLAAELQRIRHTATEQDVVIDGTQELKKEILQLRAEVNELRQKLENR